MKIIITLLMAVGLISVTQAQTFDTTGLGNWPLLTNSYDTWMRGAFDANRDTSNASDFGWGTYNVTTHLIEGDSIYILKTIKGNYKAISVDQLASGVFTITYSDLDGNNRVTKTLDRTSYGSKNFFFYSLAGEKVKDLEPPTSSWDIVFGKYLAFIPGFGSYPVSGVLHNRGVEVAQIEKYQGQNASITDTSLFPFSNDISTIGYDWKSAGPNGITINDTLTYFVKDQLGNINELKLTGYGGSATGKIDFTINGQADSIVLSSGNTDQSYYSLQNQSEVHTNQDNDWDIAIFAQSSFSAIPIRINDVKGAELYAYPKSDISHWNSVGLAERKVQVLSVYPNPANDELHLALNAEFGTEVSVALINTSGKVVKNKTLQLKGGMENLPISLQGVLPGAYVLLVNGDSLIASTRLLIQP